MGKAAMPQALAASKIPAFLVANWPWWLIVKLARNRLRRDRLRERRIQADKLQALGQLTAGIAHDFGNMVNVVTLNVAVLRELSAGRKSSEETLAALEHAVRGATSLVQQLLRFAKQKPLDVRRVNLSDWLQSSRSLFAQAAGPRITLATRVSSEIPEVLCDSAELDVALMNLVVNARDAMGGAGRISIRAFPCEDHAGVPRSIAAQGAKFVCLAVQDNGPGMTPELRRRALEPFYTTKGDAGTGLGLPQVYGFMQQLDGKLTIDPAPGGGTVIRLYFPIALRKP